MDYKNYMRKLVQSFRNNRMNRYMFIKHYNTLLISERDLHEIVVNETSSLCLLFYEFPMHVMQGAYAPFLEWIRDLYYTYFKDQTPEEFVEQAGVYSMHRQVFAEYLRTGLAKRDQDILLTELEYERSRMLQSLVSIYVYISSRKPFFVFLEKLHLANASCIQFLYALITSKEQGDIQVLGMYNELYRMPEYLSDFWKQFVDELEKRTLVFEWSSVSTESTIDVQDAFLPRESGMEEYNNCAANMYFFLALEDAKYYQNIIYQWGKCRDKEVPHMLRFQFYETFALTLLMSGEYTRALQMCEYVGELSREQQDNDWLFYDYYYLKAMCQFGMEQLENKVGLYVDQCQHIAHKHGDAIAEYKPEVLRVLSNYNYWRDSFKMHFSYQVSEKFIEDTKKFGFLNVLAHILVYCFTGDEEDVCAIIRGEKTGEAFEEGISIARKLDNLNLILSAINRNIVLFSEQGGYDILEELYQRKLSVLEECDIPIRKVHVYNGLGHNAGVAEKYTKAQEYFEISLKQTLKLEDELEVANTIYNSSINKMLAGDYEEAANDLNLLLQIMERLSLHSLDICDTSKIYGLLGYSSFQMGEEYRCYFCLNRMDAYVQHLEHIEEKDKDRFWHGTLFLLQLLRGMLHTQEGRYDVAWEEFQCAYHHQSMEEGDRYFFYPMYVLEVAKFYDCQGMTAERAAVLEDGINYCNQHGYCARSTSLMSVLERKSEDKKKSVLPPRAVTDEQIMAVIDKIAMQRELTMNKKDIDFIVIWQDLLNRNVSSQEMLSGAITVMKNYFNLDGVVMLEKTGDCMAKVYMECPESNGSNTSVTDRIRNWTQEELQQVFDYFSRNRRQILINRIDKGFLEYKELMDMLDINHIITLYAYPSVNEDGGVDSILLGYVEMRDNCIGNRYLLRERDFVILNFFSGQLYAALARLNYLAVINQMNRQLRDMAENDLLTGLYNRQGFEKRLLEDQLKEGEQRLFIYIDLDNFKYYNDTFGHEIGDFVLVRFAQLLERVVEEDGYAVRYGGDEFVLVINNRDVEFGKKVAKNIFYMMIDGLNGVIERKIGGDVVIPSDKKLSCSIGISVCRGNSKSQVQEALNRADKALYFVKKSTKNSYVVWDELEQEEL